MDRIIRMDIPLDVKEAMNATSFVDSDKNPRVRGPANI
jgi:hypothetical protein